MSSVTGWLPPKVRALASYVTAARDPAAVLMIALQREVGTEIDAVTDAVFGEIEGELAAALKRGELSLAEGTGTAEPQFSYDTRLLLPAMLTQARIHVLAGDVPVRRRLPDHRTDEGLLAAGRETTAAAVRALLDGDMRDAINDAEYEDFETNVRPRSRVAEIAQAHLQEWVQAYLDAPDTPPAVGECYRHAVSLSETHQEQDREYRALLERYREAGPDERETVADEIRERYRHAEPRDPPDLFEEATALPYFATQYERVGVLYEDMLRMYEADLGIEFDPGFKRAIVLMVIGAQVGLDDTDDYPEDRDTQLTPVTAELALHDDPAAGIERVRTIVEEYLDHAENASTDRLAGIAIEYIRQQSLERIDRLRAGFR